MSIKFINNNTEYRPLYTVNKGTVGVVLALSKNIYPELVCKLYKHKDNDNIMKNITLYDVRNDKDYKILYENNIIAQVLGIQNIHHPFSYKYYFNGKQQYGQFRDKIFYYEIGGICTLKELLDICVFDEFKHYEQINKMIDTILKKDEYMIEKTNIIHCDFYFNNVMIKNKYTLYLFDVYNKYNQTKDKKYIDILINYLFENNNLDENLSDEALIKKYNIKTFTPTKKDIDIVFIDFDYMKYIDKIMKLFDKYNKNNEDIQNIIKLIGAILINADKLKFLFLLINQLILISYNLDINIINNINKIKSHAMEIFERTINDIINKSEILQKINNISISTNLIWIICNYINNQPQNQQNFDKIVNYLYKKEYINDNLQFLIFKNNDIIDKNRLYNYVSIPYTEDEIKEIMA